MPIVYDLPTADGRPIDVRRENLAPVARLQSLLPSNPKGPLIVVPGYTPLDAAEPIRLTDVAKRRLERAVDAYGDTHALGFLVTGGNVYPAHTPYNEAWEMRRWLVEHHRFAADHVVLEPFARHSTTNLRNAGRFLLTHGVDHAVVVTDAGQGFYFGAQDLSTFRLRCKNQLGYSVGTLQPNLGFTRITFRPTADVLRKGEDPLDP